MMRGVRVRFDVFLFFLVVFAVGVWVREEFVVRVFWRLGLVILVVVGEVLGKGVYGGIYYFVSILVEIDDSIE